MADLTELFWKMGVFLLLTLVVAAICFAFVRAEEKKEGKR